MNAMETGILKSACCFCCGCAIILTSVLCLVQAADWHHEAPAGHRDLCAVLEIHDGRVRGQEGSRVRLCCTIVALCICLLSAPFGDMYVPLESEAVP